MLAIGLVLANGVALGASIETLVMPGGVVQAHEELETQCSLCHSRFDQQSQRALCLDCHEDVALDVQTVQGFHGRHPTAKEAECSRCHSEHKGRDADIVGLVAELFDHGHTDFSLEGAHERALCSGCHVDGEAYREAASSCESCHAEDDAHRGSLGKDCGSCHQAESWLAVGFDHGAATDFALDGAHGALACASCHVDEQYEGTDATCVGCHEPDDVHRGSRGAQCDNCHSVTDWQTAEFAHAETTGFALLGAHADLKCKSCHLPAMKLPEPPSECVGCHGARDPHLGRNGGACEGCHSQSSWQLAFDHVGETGFALEGAHASLTCTQCHLGELTDPVATACYACHVADDPHAGNMSECESCHTQSSWQHEIRFHHDLTRFPLLGAHRVSSCEQCHNGLAFADDVGIACVDCHRPDDVHEQAMGSACETCHVPVAWELWEFDHQTQAEFALTGAHSDLACASCHEPGDGELPPSSCVGCHSNDDVHGGAFGPNCKRCHTVDTFAAPVIGRLR